MDIGIEMSLYPLDQDFIPPIKDFIDRLNTHKGLRITTNSLSTQVFGAFDEVMRAVQGEIRTTFEREKKAVFVMKVLGPYSGE
jgi:uncharacterized protein YqgV (UPF0045/DUF77 family)